METFLNKSFCGFCKAHSTQHALFGLFYKWQKDFHSSGIVGTNSIYLSKAYDYLPHDLITAISEAYGIDKKQKVAENKELKWDPSIEVLIGIPQE